MPLRLLLAALAAVVLVVVARAPGEAGGERRTAGGEQERLLQRGEVRYGAFVRAERSSLRDRRAAGDEAAVRVHLGRLEPVRRARSTEPAAVVRAAAATVSLDARELGRVGLLDVESHVQGAALAFDAIRDAVWARDQGLAGAVDERVALVREELDRHRRGEGFLSAGAIGPDARRRLAAALDALAWRLTLVTERLGP